MTRSFEFPGRCSPHPAPASKTGNQACLGTRELEIKTEILKIFINSPNNNSTHYVLT